MGIDNDNFVCDDIKSEFISVTCEESKTCCPPCETALIAYSQCSWDILTVFLELFGGLAGDGQTCNYDIDLAAECGDLTLIDPTGAPTATPDDDGSSTNSSCSIQINTSQCDELIRENMADIPADCVNLCVAFEDGVFKQCDEGNSLSGFSSSIVAGCEFIGDDEIDDNSATGKNGLPNYIFLYFVVSGLVATAFY